MPSPRLNIDPPPQDDSPDSAVADGLTIDPPPQEGGADSLVQTPYGDVHYAYGAASGLNPDQAAETITLARKTGLPEAVVSTNKDLARRVANQLTPLDDPRLKAAPVTSIRLRDHRFMAETHDDIEGLSAIEKTVNWFSDGWRSIQTDLEAGTVQPHAELLRAAQMYSGLDLHKQIEAHDLEAQRRELGAPRFGEAVPQAPGPVSEAVHGAIRFLPTLAESSAAGAAGSLLAGGMAVAAGLPAAGVLAGGAALGGGIYWLMLGAGAAKARLEQSLDVQNKPMPEALQVAAATAIGAATAAPNMVAVTRLLGSSSAGQAILNTIMANVDRKVLAGPTWREALKIAAKRMLIASGHGGAMMAAIKGSEDTLVKFAKNASGQQFPPTREDDPWLVSLDMLKAGGHGAATFGILAAPGIALDLGRSAVRIKMHERLAEHSRQFIEDVKAKAETAKLSKRDPEAMAEHVDAVAKGTPFENVLIPVEAFEQAALNYFRVPPEHLAREMGASASYDAAKAQKDYVSVPLAKFQSKAFDAARAALANDVTFDRKVMTANQRKAEVEESAKTSQAVQEKIIDKAKQGVKEEPELKQWHDRIFDDMRGVILKFADKWQVPDEKTGQPRSMTPEELEKFAKDAPEVLALQTIGTARWLGETIEKTYGNLQERIRAGLAVQGVGAEGLPESLMQGARAFDVVQDRPFVVFAEALPAPEIAHPILQAPREVKEEFTKRAAPLLAWLPDALGLKPAATGMGSVLFRGEINPNISPAFLPIGAQASDEARMTLLARAMQFVTRQAAVPWAQARPDGPIAAIAFRFEAGITPEIAEEMKVRITKALKERAGFSILSDGKTLIVANYSDLSDAAFHEALEAHVAEQDARRLGATAAQYRTGGFYPEREHDWKADPQGLDLLRTIGEAGRSDLQDRLHASQADYDRLLETYRDGKAHPELGPLEQPGIASPQVAQESTQAFKNWFGQSKIVDESGAPRRLYHQTSEDSETGIKREGFKVSIIKNRGNDEQVPDGIFLKPTDRDIGIRGAKQIPLYASIQNPLVVSSRFELGAWLARADKTYDDLSRRTVAGDWEYKSRYDAREKVLWQNIKERGDEGYEQWKSETDAMLSEWNTLNVENATKARARATEILQAAGYDGVVIREDQGSWGRKTETIIALRPEQVKSATENIGAFDPSRPSILEQPGRQNPRARYLPVEDAIEIFRGADPTSLTHEFLHRTVVRMHEHVRSGQATEEQLADWRTLARFAGVADDAADVTVAQHETLARAWEAYIAEGRAPTPELAGLFARLREWMLQVYRDVRVNLGGEVHPEVREVFDRLLATRQEVEFARQEAGQQRVPIEGITEPEARLRATMEDRARQQAEHELMTESLRGLTATEQARIAQERDRLTAEAQESVRNMPVFVAGRDLVAAFGGGRQAHMIAERYRRGHMTAEEQMLVQATAELHGYSSADRMAREIVEAHEQNLSETRVRESVRAGLEALRTSPEELRERALRAVHSEQQGELLALEERILGQMREQREVSQEASARLREAARIRAQAARTMARDMIASQPVSEAGDYRRYITAERNASVRSARASIQGDHEKAAQAKAEQLNAHALAAEAFKARDNIRRWETFLREQGRADPKAFKNEDHFMQAMELLRRFGYGHGGYEFHMRRETLAQWMARMEAKTNTVEIADWLQDERVERPAGQITVSELQDLKNAVKNIKRVANMEDRAWVMMDKADMADIEAQIVEHAARNRLTPPITMKESLGVKLKRGWREVDSTLLAPETILLMVDGAEEGPTYRAFFRSYQDAADQKSEMVRRAVEEWHGIFDGYSKAERKEMESKLLDVPELGTSLTKLEIFMAALNVGNEGNFERLKEGRGWTDDQVWAALFGHLDKRDMDAAQAVWNWFDSYRDQLGPFYKDLTGFTPSWVEARSFQTPWGEYRGGYFPAVADPRQVERQDVSIRADVSLAEAPAVWRAHTKNGFIKGRVAQARYPLWLNFNLIQQHVTDVIHDLTFRKWVLDANRLIAREGVRSAVIDAVGQERYRALKDWVKAVAGTNPFSSRNWLTDWTMQARKRVVVAQLGLRVTSILGQIGDIPKYSKVHPDFGIRDVSSAIVGFYSQVLNEPAQFNRMRDWVWERSPMMRERAGNLNRDLSEASQQTWGKDESMARASLQFFSLMDQMTTTPVWIAAYRKRIAAGSPESEAREYANALVRRVQPPERPGDLPSIMRGSDLSKVLTLFYGAVNRELNLWYLSAGRASKMPAGKAAAELAGTGMYLWMAPALFRAWLKNGLPDDEQKVKKYLRELMNGPMGYFPFFRDVGDFMIQKSLGIGYGDFQITPIEGIIQSLGDLVERAGAKRKRPQAIGEAATKAASYAVPYPDQLNAWFWNSVDVMVNGMEPRPSDLLKRRPAKERR